MRGSKWVIRFFIFLFLHLISNSDPLVLRIADTLEKEGYLSSSECAGTTRSFCLSARKYLLYTASTVENRGHTTES